MRSALTLALFCGLSLLFASARQKDYHPKAYYAVVGVEPGDSLNVRTGPGISYPVAGRLPRTAIDIEIDAARIPHGEIWAPARYRRLTHEMLDYLTYAVHSPQVDTQVKAKEWLPIVYGQLTGWAHSHYLARQFGAIPAEAVKAAYDLVWTMKTKDYRRMAAFIHPKKGVAISPESWFEGALIFLPEHVGHFNSYFNEQTVYDWGVYDGSGEPIKLTFGQFLSAELYNAPFTHSQAVGFNVFIKQGNMVNDMPDFFPEAVFVDLHFYGFQDDFGGMDWKSLRLALEEYHGQYYVVGIGHGHWVI